MAKSCKTKEEFADAVGFLVANPDFDATEILFGRWFDKSISEALSGLELLPESDPTLREIKNTAFKSVETYMSDNPEIFLDAAMEHASFQSEWANFVFSCVQSDKGTDALFDYAETKLGQGSLKVEAYRVIVGRESAHLDSAGFRKLVELSNKAVFDGYRKLIVMETEEINWRIAEEDLRWAVAQGVPANVIEAIRKRSERNRWILNGGK